MLIYYLLFSLWIYYLSNVIKIKPTHKMILLINYGIWWMIASSLEIYYQITNDDSFYSIPTHFLIHFINITYLYEMIFHTVDTPHKLHHISSIILQQYCIHSGFLDKNWQIRLASSGYTTFITSVFSSSRDIIRYNYPRYNNIVKNLYKISYIIFKSFGIALYYLILYQNYDNIVLDQSFIVFLVFYGFIQLIQLYFMKKIISSIYNDNTIEYKPIFSSIAVRKYYNL